VNVWLTRDDTADVVRVVVRSYEIAEVADPVLEEHGADDPSAIRIAVKGMPRHPSRQ
jgi:hypothetical protein